jgi:hypothetical protein
MSVVGVVALDRRGGGKPPRRALRGLRRDHGDPLGRAVLATVERADDSVLFGLSDRGVAALEPGAPLDEAKQAMT